MLTDRSSPYDISDLDILSVLSRGSFESLADITSFRNVRLSPIDLRVVSNSDCPLDCCWANVCIVPNNFAIKASVFQPNCIEAYLWNEASLSRNFLAESSACLFWLPTLVSVSAGTPSWFVLRFFKIVFLFCGGCCCSLSRDSCCTDAADRQVFPSDTKFEFSSIALC